jgi:hypothetical protein
MLFNAFKAVVVAFAVLRGNSKSWKELGKLVKSCHITIFQTLFLHFKVKKFVKPAMFAF